MKNTRFGWPVVTASNCFEVVRDLGIKPWGKIREIPADEYLETANPSQRQEFGRFGPKVTVGQYDNPHNGSKFNGFRTHLKSSAMVFAMIDGLVPMTAEWKHGNEKITFCPVAGVSGKEEEHLSSLEDGMKATAFREWREETGTRLRSVELLCPRSGIFAVVRSVNVNYFPCIGTLDEPIEKGPTKFDDTEHLKMVLFPVEELVALLESGHLWDKYPNFGMEAYAGDTVYRALRYIGRLRLV